MSGGHCWVALLDEPAAPLTAEARDAGTGSVVGWLSVWMQAERPVVQALRADPAAFDADGPAANVSYVLVPDGRHVLFDDLGVQHARQTVLAAAGAWTAVTTLVSDPVHFRGSLLAWSPGGATLDDPFARVAPGRRLRVAPGLISAGPARLPSPVIERYAGQPWPQSGF